MNRAQQREARRVAARPPARTIDVELPDTGAFAGWWLQARTDFPASWLVELESGSVTAILAVLQRIVVDHNLPNSAGELAAKLEDVDPYDGLLQLGTELMQRLGKLPPR